MPRIKVTEILDAPIKDVWELICDLDSYPRIMNPVRSITVLSSGKDWTIAEWEVELKGSILRWTEREDRYPKNYRVEYEQVDGDLEMLQGHWELRETDAGRRTEATLEIEFEIGIPMLRDMLNPIAERALSENARIMLRSLQPVKG
jgi:ribosome-associated toxin RatA of RatAB toxin-antitoxin module